MRFLFIIILIALAPHSLLAKNNPTPEIGLCKGAMDKDCLKKQGLSFHKKMELNHVIDGDTIVADGKKIRLWGINTPEKKAPNFLAAKLLLESLLQDGELTCKFIEKDRYNRDVMHCLIDGIDVGSMMVRSGMAKDYSKYSGDYYQYEEDLAKKEKRGIWKDNLNSNNGKAPIMCTMDAKLCPDGSYVSRQGPNCIFADCP